jgi:hypothetical protein
MSFTGGILNIRGRSIPTETSISFNKLIEAFYRYSRNPNARTEIQVELEYINSSSNRSLLNLLIIAEYLFKEGFEVEVHWYHYDEEDIMFEQGQIFSELLSLPFKFIQKDFKSKKINL